jgi:hypothetical protein
MTKKDIEDLVTVISIYSPCYSLFGLLNELQYDIPKELSDGIEQLNCSLQNMMSLIDNYKESKRDTFVSACTDN